MWHIWSMCSLHGTYTVVVVARILGECSTIHSLPALFFFFFKVEISLRTLIPLFSPESVHCGSASWDTIPIPTLYLHRGMVSPLRLRWVKGVYVFRCNQPPALLVQWPDSFTRHCGNTGVERTPNKSQVSTQSLLWRRKFSRRSCRDSNSQSFDHESGALSNKLSRLPRRRCNAKTSQHVDIGRTFPFKSDL